MVFRHNELLKTASCTKYIKDGLSGESIIFISFKMVVLFLPGHRETVILNTFLKGLKKVVTIRV